MEQSINIWVIVLWLLERTYDVDKHEQVSCEAALSMHKHSKNLTISENKKRSQKIKIFWN